MTLSFEFEFKLLKIKGRNKMNPSGLKMVQKNVLLNVRMRVLGGRKDFFSEYTR